MTILVERQPAPGQRTERFGPGLVCSLVLHGLVVLLVILGLPSVLRAPAIEQVMPVGLVQLGTGSAALPRPETGEVEARQTALETRRPALADPEPVVPAAEAAPPEPEHVRQPEKPPVIAPRNKPEPTKSKPGPKLDPLAAVKPPERPSPPADDLDARLKSLARQQQLQAQMPARSRLQNDAGSSDLAAAGSGAAGGGARYNVKDFIRAQIERHWRLDPAALGAEFVIAIHVTLNRDGSVKSADIVDDPRNHASAAYQALARSARNAVLLSSPLDLPPGRYDEVADVTLNFNPRNALQ